MLSKESHAVRVAAFRGQDLQLLLADVNQFIAEEERAGCFISDVKPTEVMTSRPQTSEHDTEIYYHSYTVYVVYLEPTPQAPGPEPVTHGQPAA